MATAKVGKLKPGTPFRTGREVPFFLLDQVSSKRSTIQGPTNLSHQKVVQVPADLLVEVDEKISLELDEEEKRIEASIFDSFEIVSLD